MSPRAPWHTARLQLGAVFRKEVRQTIRDRRVMFLLIVAPLIQTVIFGFAVDFDVDRVPTVLVDQDQSDQSRLHARRVLADQTLRHVGDVAGVPEADHELDQGRAAVALVIPHRLADDLASGRPAEVQVLLDGTDPNRAMVASGAVSRYFGEAGERIVRERLEAAGRPAPAQVVLVPRVLYNPRLKTAPYVVPGIAGTLLVIVTTLVTAMGLSREREMGTMEQVLVTPIRPVWLLVGKLLPFLVIGLFDVLLLVGVGSWVFEVPLRGSLLVGATGVLLYVFSTLGVGLLISTLSQNQQQAFLGGFIFMMPAILLSGVMTPIRGMPGWLQVITWFNPVRHFAEVMRGVLMRGSGFADLWFQLGFLALLGAGVMALAVSRFRTQLG
jgi:ABC-2 type transport system permease protein